MQALHGEALHRNTVHGLGEVHTLLPITPILRTCQTWAVKSEGMAETDSKQGSQELTTFKITTHDFTRRMSCSG